MSRVRPYIVLIFCLLVPLGVGAATGWLTADDIATWYTGLRKPAFNPPNEVFGPVWTGLYALMGISLFLIWMSPEDKTQRKAKFIFFEQLLLNAAWSVIFFEYHQIGWALVELAVLWVSIIRMILQFRYVNYLATLLQLPYLAWVSFALILNATIWWLNSGFSMS